MADMEHAFTDNGPGAHPKGGSRAVGPQTPKTEIKKKNVLCSYDGIKGLT